MEGASGSSTPYPQQPLLSHPAGDAFADGSVYTPRSTFSSIILKEWLLGDIDWSYVYKPLSIYDKKSTETPQMRFRGIGDFVPVLLNILLGIQHMGVAFGPVILPAATFAYTFRGVFDDQYTIQSALIISGIASLLQCMHIRIPGTPYHIGTGMAAFLGNSLVFGDLFRRLTWKIAMDDGISFPDAYGKVLGSAAICAVLFIGLTLIPRHHVQVLFPPAVTGSILVLVGLDSLTRGIQYWGGGMDCVAGALPCLSNGNVRLSYGSPEYIGLGFMFVAIFLLIHFFGSAFLRQNSVFVASTLPYILSIIVPREGKHYVTGDVIDAAETFNYLWDETYKLGVHKSVFLPVLGGFLVSYLYTTTVLTATLEESKIDATGTEANLRIQGGLIVTAVMSLFAVLATGIPVIPVAENNSFISTSKVASRMAGISGAIVLIICGAFGHIAALVHQIPIVIEGGLITTLAVMIIQRGLRILRRESWDGRTSTIMLYAFVFGLGNILVANFITSGIWPLGEDPNDVVHTLQFAITSMISVPYFLGGFVAVTLHLLLPADDEEAAHATLVQEEGKTTELMA